MSEYWKSTPSYWCKFCSQYVRDTSIERKNHEASAKHQNNIQRSLRELHKNKEHETRDKQRAKDEVARLNGMVGGKAGSAKSPAAASVVPAAKGPRTTAPAMTSAAQRKAHAEQLAALGVELPDELKKEVAGVGSYQVVNARSVEPAEGGSVSVNRSLAEILAEAKREGQDTDNESKSAVKTEESVETLAKGVYKRKADNEDDDIRDEEAAPKRRAWGRNLKKYPGSHTNDDDTGDLDALLSGVKRKPDHPKALPKNESEAVKQEEGDDGMEMLQTIPDVERSAGDAREKQSSEAPTTPAVVFKKRKGKK
ncbi:hypothetical protein CLAFUW4_01018 [Fulvia fulva]|uniref:Matrin-type domain-containing protein n=1 Tax=Passalora fulva TaxID=5499 RepID=A0A9Q8L649_PASFU|nr:uncharacterized protein CLAFUR5_01024 [Fulvia fulva]KAK4634272.1 hypothetical protein CLAFUR4_01019 [Fulvia fulva]KAK4638192.1 hypothetical protein CLAFUR0_01020 [Fulvia fulva]UJO11523.1 hypothetical protein CLAFUR5_01024 [Fulvia fulva]WPV09634.1 hypothetical protein CLAFUW4_01018 [Fulvia fulva]WPV25306.1 hypothetical protein CLAFUW7_00798 [Fulvia fulva]